MLRCKDNKQIAEYIFIDSGFKYYVRLNDKVFQYEKYSLFFYKNVNIKIRRPRELAVSVVITEWSEIELNWLCCGGGGGIWGFHLPPSLTPIHQLVC